MYLEFWYEKPPKFTLFVDLLFSDLGGLIFTDISKIQSVFCRNVFWTKYLTIFLNIFLLKIWKLLSFTSVLDTRVKTYQIVCNEIFFCYLWTTSVIKKGSRKVVHLRKIVLYRIYSKKVKKAKKVKMAYVNQRSPMVCYIPFIIGFDHVWHK